MNKMMQRHPDVQFLFIATQERPEGAVERVKKYITSNNYPFHVLMDKPLEARPQMFEALSAYKVEGIPTKVVIDAKGKQRFFSVGFTSDTELINEMEAMIQLVHEGKFLNLLIDAQDHYGMRAKIIIVLLCSAGAFIGFMWKLPPEFTMSVDKELHAVFYFSAAAFLNILFKVKHVLAHILIFGILYVAGLFIEYVQAYSNQFFHKRIHGRFDPEDVQNNLKGLIIFSVIWIIAMAMLTVYRYVWSVNKGSGDDEIM